MNDNIEKTGAQAVEHLQAAAIEAIRAMRSFLDIAESLVQEPETVALVARSFVDAAASALRPSTLAGEEHEAGEPDTEEQHGGRVRRINVTD
jgi:hypothetical protein